MSDIQTLEKTTLQVRRDILRMVHKVNSGHPGGSLGCTEFFVVLYFELMDFSLPFSMDGKNEDVFFLSNGHISPVFYSVLSRRGFFPVDELNTFRLINSRLQGHPTTHEGLPGVRIASGSLGQGLSVALGVALTKKLNHDPKTVYVECVCVFYIRQIRLSPFVLTGYPMGSQTGYCIQTYLDPFASDHVNIQKPKCQKEVFFQ